MEKVEQLTREVKQVEMRTVRRTVVIVKKVVQGLVLFSRYAFLQVRFT